MTSRSALLLATLFLLTPSLSSAGEPPPQAFTRLKEAGTISYRLGHFQQALDKYSEAYKAHQEPLVLYNIAQCHRHLGNTKKAIFFYKLHLEQWAKLNPGKPSPASAVVGKHLARLNEKLKQEEQRAREEKEREREAEAARRAAAEEAKRAGAAKNDVAPTPDVRPKPQRPQKNKAWLVVGISTAALAAGALGLGVAFDLKAQDSVKDSDEWARNGNVALAGYISAGALALASGVSWFLYWYSGQPDDAPPVSAGVAPTSGGALFSGSFRF